MQPEQPSRALAFGVAASIALHLGAGVALVTRDAWGAEPDMVESTDPLDRLPPQQQQITLGETTSTAMSMTWIGYDEYREQFANKGEVEQAALQRDPSGGGRPMPALPAPNPAAIAKAMVQPAVEAADRVMQALEALPMPSPDTPDEIAVAEQPDQDQDEADAPLKEAEPVEMAMEETPSPPQRPEETPHEQPVSAGEGAATGPGTGAVIADGQQSERESDASSLVETNVKQLGQPLAARGLRINTTKPRLSYHTQIMGKGQDPVVRIFFASDGRVRNVEFLRRSGNVDIDRPVEDALYFWKAEGEALATLGDPKTGETISVDVRIIQ